MNDPVVVDSAAFARESGKLQGTIALARLSRLHGELFDQSGDVGYALTGFVSSEQKPSLQLEISGKLKLTCHHCLGPVEWEVDSKRNFELVPAGEALGDPAEEPQDVEQIFADPKLDVIGLIEDEIILGMPMATKHEAGCCSPPAPVKAQPERATPFSVLAGIKR
jgi:uncharacterized protein